VMEITKKEHPCNTSSTRFSKGFWYSWSNGHNPRSGRNGLFIDTYVYLALKLHIMLSWQVLQNMFYLSPIRAIFKPSRSHICIIFYLELCYPYIIKWKKSKRKYPVGAINHQYLICKRFRSKLIMLDCCVRVRIRQKRTEQRRNTWYGTTRGRSFFFLSHHPRSTRALVQWRHGIWEVYWR
jgi:hypothetical protein